MKEAFWGVLIIILGLFGIVVVNLFQNVTVDNDRVYYLIKESTEASALDALDFTYYRLNGDIRIVEDKFVENLTRRFSENVTIGNYRIVIEDLNEVPPKISLRIRSGVTSLMGDTFGIVNRVDALIEAKYNLDEVLDFLGITEEEWISHRSKKITEVDSETGENVCNIGDFGDSDPECMPGDIKFGGFGGINMSNYICATDTPASNVARTAKYKTCECGKWSDEKEETIYANPVKSGNKYVYTWKFNRNGTVRNLSETITFTRTIGKCITGIKVGVPKDIDRSIRYTGRDDPRPHSGTYVDCPSGGITLLKGAKIVLAPTYTPVDTNERNAKWTVANADILTIEANKDSNGFTNVSSTCELNENKTNCKAKATITAKEAGTTTVSVESSRGHKSSCKITVWDGNPNSVSCNNMTVMYGKPQTLKVNFSPSDTVNKKVTYSIANTNIATINEKGLVTFKGKGSTNVTVTTENGKTGTCKITADDGKVTKIGCEANKKTIKATGTAQFSAVLTPKNATNTNIKWSVSGSAKIDGSGFLVGNNSSTKNVTVTVTVKDTVTGKTGKCNIIVEGRIIPKPPTPTGGGGGECSCTHGVQIISWDYSTIPPEPIWEMHTCPGEKIIEQCGDSEASRQRTYCTTADTTCIIKTVKCTQTCPSGQTLTSSGCKTCKELGKYGTQKDCEVATTAGKYSCTKDGNCYTRGSRVCNSGYYLTGSGCMKCPYTSLTGCRRLTGGYGRCSTLAANCYRRDSVVCYKGYKLIGKLCRKDPTSGGSGGSSGGGGGSGGQCFVAGTKIHTIDGFKNIEDIEIGDLVLSYNEALDKTEYNKVYDLFERHNNEGLIYELTINGNIINVTSTHTFYINKSISKNILYKPETLNNNDYKVGSLYSFPSINNGFYWVQAMDLQIGDMVMLSDGSYHPITSIRRLSHDGTVYNFSVENNNNYFVTEDGILVHNQMMCKDD